MLEKYSKTKSFMFVRKRKAARRKRQGATTTQASAAGPNAEEYEGEEEDGGAEKDVPSYAEHTFTFQAFEKVSRHLCGLVQVDCEIAIRN